jgi:molybdopterin-guanine dinucleotide biosynthesis protein A
VLDAVAAATTEIVLVVACDLVAPAPSAMATVVAALAAAPEAEVAVPVVDGIPQWHHAAWRRSARGRLARARAEGAASLRRAATGLAVVEVGDVPRRAVADADRPGDLWPR